jgi:hypothetical protein
MSTPGRIVLFVHGWSVRNTDTYGALPERLRSEARRDPALGLDVKELWLGEYISFHDEVRIPDIARAFDAAVRRELGVRAADGFACITHSTGGPVLREWLARHADPKAARLSHLIMLAPANFGSALAQLAHSRLARLRTMFEGVEPGLGVLDWLELGSPENLALNLDGLGRRAGATLPFVLTGASIDRALYDHVNAYTGELGTDGVVRAASANLNFAHVVLAQEPARPSGKGAAKGAAAPLLSARRLRRAKGIPFALLEGRAHSGDARGVMRSVRDDGRAHPTVDAILECLQVRDARGHAALAKRFARHNAEVEARQRVERHEVGPFAREYLHDPCAMLVFRVRDDQGDPVKDFEIVLTSGADNPDALPPGFFIDRQRNRRDPGTVIYYVNAAKLLGAPAVVHGGRTQRAALKGAGTLGLKVIPYPQDGFVHYLPCALPASAAQLAAWVRPHETTVVDIVLRRVVREGVFRLTRERTPTDFTKAPPGGPIE